MIAPIIAGTASEPPTAMEEGIKHIPIFHMNYSCGARARERITFRRHFAREIGFQARIGKYARGARGKEEGTAVWLVNI